MQPRPRPSLPLIAAFCAVIIVAGIIMFGLGQSPPSVELPMGGFQVTIFPTLPGPAPTPVPGAEQATAAPAPAIEPSPTPRVTQYVVQPNDTLWDIAVRFGFNTLDAIQAANPGLNPDFLSLGQVINIPGADFVLPPRAQQPQQPAQPQLPAQPQQPSVAGAVPGTVRSDAGGLRLRQTPGFDGNVITRLGPDTQLQVLGQVAGQDWLKVVTPSGTEGYVDAQYINIGGAVVLSAQPDAANAQPQPVAVGPLDYPYLSDIGARVTQIYQAGQARGNSAHTFSVIGDSNSQNPAFLKPIDWGNYNLGNYTYLQSTVDFFKGSFGKDGPASIGGFNTTKVLDPANSPGSCAGASPLECEYNTNRPSVALILLGTGDQHTWQNFESNYRRIIETSINMGVIPVLMTKADDLECRDNSAPCGFINGKIASLAYEYQVPLLNLRQVMDRLPGGGTQSDGFHYNFPGGDKSAWLTNDYLQYGYNQRNLTALQVLDVLRRRVIAPGS